MRDARILILFTAGLALAGCGTVGGWFGFGKSVPRVKPAELVEFKASAGLARAWEVQAGAGRPYVFSPAGDGQAVYVAGREGRVLRIDLASGREVWRVETGKVLSAGVGAGAGLVVVATPKGEVLAFNAADGKSGWTAALGGEILNQPVVGAAGVAVRSLDGRVSLLGLKDGKKLWTSGKSLPSLVLRDGGDLLLTPRALYAGYPGGKLQALSLANGAPLWEASVAQPRGATEIERIADVTGALAADDRIVCGVAYQGRLSCFDQANGNPVWSRDFSGLGGLAEDATSLYAADAGDLVHAFDKQRGSGTWKQGALSQRKLATPLALGRYVALADSLGYIHLLNAADGALAARAATDGSAISGRMLALDAGLVAQTANGGVFAFKLQEPGQR